MAGKESDSTGFGETLAKPVGLDVLVCVVGLDLWAGVVVMVGGAELGILDAANVDVPVAVFDVSVGGAGGGGDGVGGGGGRGEVTAA